jgi:hypothetical protein
MLILLLLGHRDMVNVTVRTDLSRIQRTNLETCITVHMHQKESTQDLVNKKVGLLLLPLTTPGSAASMSCSPKGSALTLVQSPCNSAACYCEASCLFTLDKVAMYCCR